MIAANLRFHPPVPDQGPKELLERLWPQVRSLMASHFVPAEEAEGLVQDTLVALVYKWDRISNHEYWLLKALDARCRRLSAENAMVKGVDPS